MKTTPFAIALNNIKRLGVALNKQEKVLYYKIFKSLKKEIQKHIRRWKDLPLSWIIKINIVKVLILPKDKTQFPSKFNAIFKLEGTILSFIWKNKYPDA